MRPVAQNANRPRHYRNHLLQKPSRAKPVVPGFMKSRSRLSAGRKQRDGCPGLAESSRYALISPILVGHARARRVCLVALFMASIYPIAVTVVRAPIAARTGEPAAAGTLFAAA